MSNHIGKYAYGTVAAQTGFVNAAAAGTTAVVAATPGKKIRVLAFFFVTGGTQTDATFKSDTTAVTPLIANTSYGGAVMNHNPLGWFETASGEGLNVTLGAGSTTGVHVRYVLI